MLKKEKRHAGRFACLLLGTVFLFGNSAPYIRTANAATEGVKEEITTLSSEITDMDLGGYVGENLKGNIQNWQLTAYENNPNIIEQIALGGKGRVSFSSVLGTDWFGVDNYYAIDVAQTADEISEKYIGTALMYSPKKADAYRGDAGYRLDSAMYPGIRDWTGTKEAWVFIDASNYGADVYLRFNFEEGEPDSALWDAFTPIQGVKGRLISAIDGAEGESTYQWYDAYGDAFFKIDKGFKGFLALPFSNDGFWRYAGDGNSTVDGKNVRQLTIAVGGATQEAVGTPLYFAFAKVGEYADGLTVPFEKGLAVSDKFVNVLPVSPYTFVLDINVYMGAYVGALYDDWDVYFTTNYRGHSGNSLGWTLKSVPDAFNDRDIRFANDPNAITDWTGAKELWVYADASEVSSEVQVRIAFEENAVGRESYSLKDGATVYLLKNGEDTYRTRQVSVHSGGYVTLPAKFAGYIRLPLNADTFGCYWQENGNNVLDISNVVQFQMAIGGGQEMVGKTVYLDDFTVVGDVNGEKLHPSMYLGSNPADGSNAETAWKYVDTAYTAKKVWSMDGLAERNNYTGGIMIWYGEFVGKLLTGMAYSYKATADADLKAAADKIVEDLAKAQGADGYLGTYTGVARFSIGQNNWDLWNHYHCITGLLEWYAITGNQTALDVAKKAIDCVYETFKDRSYLVAGGFETNRGIAHGYAQMYQATGEEKYLAEAERIIMQDCQDVKGWYKTALADGNFYQTSSSRWEVLHMIMTLKILYEETGNTEYFTVMDQIWHNILELDIHNTGGFTTNEGACGDPYRTGVIETCCTIAWMAFTNEYYKIAKTVEVADEFERSYYNGMLGSLLDNDKYTTYNTPMNGVQGTAGGYDGRKVPSQQDISFQYNSGSPDFNCCQANLARGLGQIVEWAALTDGNALYLNYYGESNIRTQVGGKAVALKQETNYPVSGSVAITVGELAEDTQFALKLRIPGWAFGSKIKVNGEACADVVAGEYYTIDRTWKNGDVIQLELAMQMHYWTGAAGVSGYTSVYYGSVLMTLDKSFAPQYNQNTTFTVAQLEAMEISDGSAVGAMLIGTVKIGNDTVKLIDFASAGKYNGESAPATYWSWLKVADAPAAKNNGLPIWQNSDRNKVFFGENIDYAKASFYAGDTVTFTVAVPDGKQVDEVKVSTGAEVTEAAGAYTFTMPDEEEVSVWVTFKDDETSDDPVNPPAEDPGEDDPVNPPADDPQEDKGGCGSVAVGGACVALIGAAFAAMALRKRNR